MNLFEPLLRNSAQQLVMLHTNTYTEYNAHGVPLVAAEQLLGPVRFARLMRDPIRKHGPVPHTVYPWNIVDYLANPKLNEKWDVLPTRKEPRLNNILCNLFIYSRKMDLVKYRFVRENTTLPYTPSMDSVVLLETAKDSVSLLVEHIVQTVPIGSELQPELRVCCTFFNGVSALKEERHVGQLAAQIMDLGFVICDPEKPHRALAIPADPAAYVQRVEEIMATKKPAALPSRPRRPTRLVLRSREIDEVTYTLVQDLDMAVCGVGDGLKHDCQPGFMGAPLGLEVVSVLEPSHGDPWLVTAQLLQAPSVTPVTQAAFIRRMATYGFLPRA